MPLPSGIVKKTFDITPGATELAVHADCLYVGVSGHVEVVPVNQDTATVLKNLAAGVFHPIAVKKVLSGANTTATDIRGGVL